MDSKHSGTSKGDRPACAKCGYSGHLTFQCRNFIRTNANKEVVLDVSSTSSESEDDMTTPLTTLRAAELKVKLESLKRKNEAVSNSEASTSEDERAKKKRKKDSKSKKEKKKKKEKKRHKSKHKKD